MSDLELIEQILKGENHAFTTLVNKHKDMTYSLALRITQDVDLAEEIAQDVFTKVYFGLKDFNRESKFTTWLYRIVINTSYTALRQKKPYEKVNYEDNFIEMGHSIDGFELLKQEDRNKSIHLALDELEKMEAVILTLFYLEEYSIQEMVETTGLSQANVKVKLHRARKKLAEIIQTKFVELID